MLHSCISTEIAGQLKCLSTKTRFYSSYEVIKSHVICCRSRLYSTILVVCDNNVRHSCIRAGVFKLGARPPWEAQKICKGSVNDFFIVFEMTTSKEIKIYR